MSFASEFKEFALKGNVVDLAVGVIIGAAFGKIVDSLVKDLIMPIVGKIFGGLDFSSYFVMLANAPAGEEELRDLANRRAKAVMDWLTGPGKIPRERIFLLPPKLGADDKGSKSAPFNRTDFSLR